MMLDTLIATLTPLAFTNRMKALYDLLPNARIVCSTSFSYEDQILTHLIADQNLPISLFTLDTGRLFEETYATWHATQKAYPHLSITSYAPDAQALATMITQQGVNGFYESKEQRLRCCHVRKVEPLQRALDGVDVWISGLRRSHSSFRHELPMLEMDATHGVIKCYPLIDMADDALRPYIDTHKVPYNALHDQGFPSIGCAPCTRAVAVGDHPRSGRWWWEDESAQECGLHLVDGKLVRAKKD